VIKQLAHACIHSADLDQTRRFYCEVLGCRPGFEFRKQGELVGCYISLGGETFIEVFLGEPTDAGGIKHLAIEVSDIDAVLARCAEYNVEASEKKLGHDQSWQAWVTDPNGVRLEFQQYTAESCQRTGAVCDMS